MPVSTRSQCLTTPRALREHVATQPNNDSCSWANTQPGCAETVALHSRRRHASLLKGDLALGNLWSTEMGFANDRLQTPRPHTSSPKILGASNWAKDAHVVNDRSESALKPGATPAGRVAFSCPKPAKHAEGIRGSRLSSYGGQTELRARKRPFDDALETLKEDDGQTPSTRIMVYVRLRPMSKYEKDAGARSCVRVANKRDVYLTEFALETDYLRLKRLKGRHFAFDAAFPEVTGQQEVYNTSTADLVESVLQGRNCSVFCYGATGAGKTHTMLGTTQSPGIMVLALKDLFSKLNQRCREGDYVVRLSYLEVYNESVKDLLSPGRPLVLREDSKQGIIAAGLTQYQAFSADEVMALLQRGNQNRTTEPTRVNETSSRSHAILQVTVEYKTEQDSFRISRMGKLSLIDLAGSERALATDQRTIRSVEGANINRSLLALSSCINALVEGKRHIPFRNSKLTQLLKDSLGGVCQTSMIANISPSYLSFGETQNTLHWADRAKEIRTKACDAKEEIQVPESASEQAKLLLEVQKENQQLRMQLARLQQKLLTVQSNAMIAHAPPAPSACRTPEMGRHISTAQEQQQQSRRTIEELQRTVQALEKERELSVREAALREEKLAACISSLQREHSVELRHKDNFIRTLCQKKTATDADQTPARPKTAFHRVPVEASRSTRMSRGGDCATAAPTTTPRKSTAAPPPPTARKPPPFTAAPPAPPPRKQPLIAAPTCTGTGTRRMSRSRADPPPPFTPSKAGGGSRGSKRTFWDITNANSSPSSAAVLGRCTRSNNNVAATPSMLLQPGFLRERRALLL